MTGASNENGLLRKEGSQTASVKFLLRTTKKEGLATINVRFYTKELSTFAPIGKRIEIKNWDKNDIIKLKEDLESAEKEEIKTELRNLSRHLRKLKNHIIDSFEDEINIVDRDWLILTIDKYNHPEKYKPKIQNFYNYIDSYVKSLDTRLSTKTNKPLKYRSKREFHRTFDLLKDYAKEINPETQRANGFPDFDNIDVNFYYDFVDYLKKEGYQDNTIGKRITTLKTVLHSATAENINNNNQFKSKRFKAPSETPDNAYLNINEVNQLFNYDFSENTRLEKVRDLFIVGCWTGLRYADLIQVTPEKIEGDYITITQNKTGNEVVIPIHPSVKEILEKYEGKLPKPISNQKYNDYIKEACKIAKIDSIFTKKTIENGMSYNKKYKKYELISSHSARRTFCSNAYEMDIPALIIMAISGHRTERSFFKYIKTTPKTHAEKMLNHWKEKNQFITKAN